MLVDQKGDDDDGNQHEDWNITGTGLGKTSVEPRFLYNQANGYLGREGMRTRHKEVEELMTVTPAAMTCVSNKLCLKGLT